MRCVGAGLWYGGKIAGCGAAGNGFRGLHIHYFRSGMHKRKKHMAYRKKYKPCILKYKALISKYMPYIFRLSKYLTDCNL